MGGVGGGGGGAVMCMVRGPRSLHGGGVYSLISHAPPSLSTASLV